jgi:hypothetical protein
MTRVIPSMGSIALAALLLVTAGVPLASQDVNPQARALKEFGDRARAYLELRARLGKSVPPVSEHATAEEIRIHQERLAAEIRQARRGAKPGDIFTPPVVPLFRAVIRSDLKSRDIRDAMAAMQEVPPTLSLYVNEPWPEDAPRGTVPPRLLNSLYPLPDGLEYRFLDRHLVLVDGEADLIVDFVKNVVPSIVRRGR